MVRQRNRRIHFRSGFFGSFDAPWSEISWIDLSGKETQNPFSDSFGFKNPNLDFLKETHPMFIQFFCLCPLSLTIKLNFNTYIEQCRILVPSFRGLRMERLGSWPPFCNWRGKRLHQEGGVNSVCAAMRLRGRWSEPLWRHHKLYPGILNGR